MCRESGSTSRSTTPNGHPDGKVPKTTRFSLPGFTLPLNYEPENARYEALKVDGQWKRVRLAGDGRSLFANALQYYGQAFVGRQTFPLTTLREFNMLHFMNEITDKADWKVKVFNDEIAARWKTEVMQQSSDFSQKMADYCLEELRYKAAHPDNYGMISVYPGDVVKSDSAVLESLKKQLQSAVSHLESLQERCRDYHPGSDGLVLDLVHPSLFPLVYGRSRILKDRLIGVNDCIESCGEGEVLAVPLHTTTSSGSTRRFRFQNTGTREYSQKFQWLPCEVDFLPPGQADENPTKCTITSYINNLHPREHKDLYCIIAMVIDRTIPLWDMTLTSLKHNFINPLRIQYEQVKYDPDPDRLPEDQQPQRQDGEEDDGFYNRWDQWARDTRKVVQPEPAEFETPLTAEEPVNLARDYASRGLQVIVKLASIHLTPDTPAYEGGSWHVEGQLNEHVCATGLYYYDSDNITESRLAFVGNARQILTFPTTKTTTSGWKKFSAVNRTVPVCKKWAVWFAVRAVYLHSRISFSIEKILALFLVDPNIRVISTANVPPQRKDWWSDKLLESGVFNKLSRELHEMIIDGVDEFPIGLEEAKKLRLELMEERKTFSVQHEAAFQANEFSLCEH